MRHNLFLNPIVSNWVFMCADRIQLLLTEQIHEVMLPSSCQQDVRGRQTLTQLLKLVLKQWRSFHFFTCTSTRFLLMWIMLLAAIFDGANEKYVFVVIWQESEWSGYLSPFFCDLIEWSWHGGSELLISRDLWKINTLLCEFCHCQMEKWEMMSSDFENN